MLIDQAIFFSHCGQTNTKLRFNVPLDTKQVVSQMLFIVLSLLVLRREALLKLWDRATRSVPRNNKSDL